MHPATEEDPVTNETLISSSKATFHQAPVKPTLLTRPQSSHEDPALGFSFTKAKPAQSFDFSRKPLQNGITAPKQDESPPFSPTEAVHRRADQDGLLAETTVRPIEGNTFSLDDPLAVPFPLLHGPSTRDHHTPHTNPIKAPQSKTIRSDGTRETGSMSGDETLIASDPTIIAPTHHTPGPAPMAIVEPPQAHSAPSGTPIKATKPQRTNKRKSKPHVDQNGRSLTPETTEEDLLSLLSHKMYKSQKEREEFRAMQLAKDCELEDLKHLINDLYFQLQETKLRSKDKEAELDKIKSLKSGWETKIKKLGDYVQGLSNDHNGLRKDAKDIQTRQTELDVDKQELREALHAIHQDTGRDTTASKCLIVKGRHQIELLEQNVRRLQNQLRKDEGLLEIEKGRNTRLENDISRITTSHEQLLGIFASHRDTVNISQLLTHVA